MPRGFYAVTFAEEEDYQHALFKGPWMIADHYLLVQRWRQNFLMKAKKESRVAVWAKIPELSLELYHQKFFKRLGSALGCYLKMDNLTTFQSRGQFARICIEVDLAKPLVPHVFVRGEKFVWSMRVCMQCVSTAVSMVIVWILAPVRNLKLLSSPTMEKWRWSKRWGKG